MEKAVKVFLDLLGCVVLCCNAFFKSFNINACMHVITPIEPFVYNHVIFVRKPNKFNFPIK